MVTHPGSAHGGSPTPPYRACPCLGPVLVVVQIAGAHEVQHGSSPGPFSRGSTGKSSWA